HRPAPALPPRRSSERPAYRDGVSEQQVVIGGLAKAAESMVAVIEEPGYLISAVRIMVRDAIVACVSQLAGYAAEVLVIDGAATPDRKSTRLNSSHVKI